MKKLLQLCLLGAAILGSQLHTQAQDYTRNEVIYGRKFGTALTFDVFQPAKPNGYAIAFMVSGGFYSNHDAINPGFYKPFLDRGYAVFAVVHGSQPRFVIPEITEDIHRAIRFIRAHAKEYGINPDKIGISGASAGGHLSLTMGTQGKPGPADAKDKIDRESSAVQAVACFFPPTDFLNWGQAGEDAVGVGKLKDFKGAFGSRSDTAEGRATYGKEISPINFVSAKSAPILIIHGDADGLVPIQQAEIFMEAAKKAGATAELVVRKGKDHGWNGMQDDVQLFADWFDLHLRGIKKETKTESAKN